MPVSTQDLEVGDIVYGSFGQYGRIDVRAGSVLKKTPTGQICADFQEKWAGNGKERQRRFNKSGWEIGGHASYSGNLIDEETYQRMAARQKSAAAVDAVTAHLRSWGFKNKAELNAYVDRLVELAGRVPDDWSAR